MKTQDLIAISLMTFAMFLGAGNIIFPPALGLEAGTQLIPAMFGFLITSVGLPALTIIVLGRINLTENLTVSLPKWVGHAFWIVLFTAIGPAFAMPRAVTVAYEIGIKPFIENDQLLIFSVIFSVVTLVFALKSSNLVDYIGKVITPLLILLILALTCAAIFFPLGAAQLPTAAYQENAVTEGLIQGYMTMDALGAVGFGWVIINAINAKGVTKPKDVAKIAFKVALIYGSLMAACYIAMGYVGATSSTIAANASNGGEILALYVASEFGVYGQWLLAAIIILACLTTTVGLANACGQYCKQTFNGNFVLTVVIVVALTGIFANFGLNQILTVSLPAILVLCPVAIALVLASLVFPENKEGTFTHLGMLIAAIVFGSLDAVSILGKMPEGLNVVLEQSLPLYNAHASWFIPCLVVLMASRVQNHVQMRSAKQA